MTNPLVTSISERRFEEGIDANGYAVLLFWRGTVNYTNPGYLYVAKDHKYKLTGLSGGMTYCVHVAAVNNAAATQNFVTS
jgi:hypothetical protein